MRLFGMKFPRVWVKTYTVTYSCAPHPHPCHPHRGVPRTVCQGVVAKSSDAAIDTIRRNLTGAAWVGEFDGRLTWEVTQTHRGRWAD